MVGTPLRGRGNVVKLNVMITRLRKFNSIGYLVYNVREAVLTYVIGTDVGETLGAGSAEISIVGFGMWLMTAFLMFRILMVCKRAGFRGMKDKFELDACFSMMSMKMDKRVDSRTKNVKQYTAGNE